MVKTFVVIDKIYVANDGIADNATILFDLRRWSQMEMRDVVPLTAMFVEVDGESARNSVQLSEETNSSVEVIVLT
uniref:Uncharacterized protein n=1 Tax=Heterorhabditis bacteriophora TaxID=37862 RepID=A0A1I7WWE7_HETBA